MIFEQDNNSSTIKVSMSTVTATQQLHLVNIISLAEDKLQSNFTIILNRLRDHDRLLAKTAQGIQDCREDNLRQIQKNNFKAEDSMNKLRTELEAIKIRLSSLEQRTATNEAIISENTSQIVSINDNANNFKLGVEEEFQVVNNYINEINENINSLENLTNAHTEELVKKESVVEVEKVIKRVSDMHQKNVIIDNEIRLLQHKMEKMEIMNQKAERVLAKRDADLLKDVEERIKKELKTSLSASTPSRGRQSVLIPGGELSGMEHRLSFKMEDEESESLKKNSLLSMEKNLGGINQKCIIYENQLKEINDSIKVLRDQSKKHQASSSDGMTEKLNEIKSQMIKLWAKFDALEDRIVFTDRKMEEKSKLINGLIEMQKENSWAKMDDKLKTFQTEMYAFIKEMKVKVEGKLASQQFQKFSQVLDVKIKQINEMLFQKSDKLEVKKALLFLESKIKEIILVISEDEENQKDALLTKKQIKCISCDKDVEKLTGISSGVKGNWDCLPYRDHAPEILGRFGMTNYGSLAKKLKRLEGQDLPVLSRKKENQNQPKSP